MSEWREVALGEVLDVTHGYAFKGEHFRQGGEIRLVTPGNFYDTGGFRDRGELQKSYEGSVPEGYVLPPGALIVAMTEQAPGLLGSSGVVPWDGLTWLHNQRIGLVKARVGEADERFLYPLFNHPAVRAQISATASGTKVRHTSPGRLRTVRVRLPTIRTQRRIAAVLSAFDELIEINERRIELLETLARSLYREWFVRFRFPGYADAGFTDSELGSIPATWEVRRLGDIAQVQRRIVSPAKEVSITFEHFSIPAFDSGRLPRRELGATIKSHKQVIEGECVLLSKINPRIERVWFAEPSTNRALASTEFLAFTGPDLSNAWLWATFRSESFRHRLRGLAGGTSTSHQRVKPRDVAAHPVLIADREVLDAFDSIGAPALQTVTALRRHNLGLAATRDLLLPRLVTGQLDIADLDLGDLLPPEAA